MVLIGAWRVGVSTDEPAHVVRYENLHTHGWFLLDDDFDGNQPGAWVTDRYVYGPVFTEVMHASNRLLGRDPPGALGTSLESYVGRHLLVALCGLLGTCAVAAVGRRLLGSWSWGLVSAATVMAIPMWPGLSMFDMKDVPAATGYTWVTLGLVELLQARRSMRDSLVGFLSLVPGVVLAVGTRPGLWAGLAVSIVAAACLAAAQPGGRLQWLDRVLLPLVSSCLVAYVLLLASYPAFFAHPLRWLPGSIGESADYDGSAIVDTQGHWAYIPERVVTLMPPLLLVVGAAGCLAAALGRRIRVVTPEIGGWLVVGLQALLLPLGAIMFRSTLYSDLRQVLFACPAVALLLTAGWKRVSSDIAGDSVRRGGSPRTGVVRCVVCPSRGADPALSLRLFVCGALCRQPRPANRERLLACLVPRAAPSSPGR
jgi:hypothetical protein